MDEETLKKIVDIAHDTKDIAKNAVEPASKNVGEALGTFTGFFANVVLYPLKCLNAKFEQKAIAFERKMQEKYNNIPQENRTDAPVNILGPVLESLKYNIDEEYMQELFANLLSDCMDKTKQGRVHPKYVKTISSMNEVDAKIFNYLYTTHQTKYIKAGKISIKVSNTDKVYVGALPSWILIDDIENYSIFEISRSIIRLNNLGLLDLMFDRTTGSESALNEIYNKKEVVDRLNFFKTINPNVELDGIDCIIFVNDDGANFANIVFKG